MNGEEISGSDVEELWVQPGRLLGFMEVYECLSQRF